MIEEQGSVVQKFVNRGENCSENKGWSINTGCFGSITMLLELPVEGVCAGGGASLDPSLAALLVAVVDVLEVLARL